MSTEVQRILSAIRGLSIDEQIELLSLLRETPAARVVEDLRRKTVLEVQGKYAHVLTSSEEFIQRKQEELELER